MKTDFCAGLIVFAFSTIAGLAQANQLHPVPTPSRVIVTNTIPKPQPTPTPLPKPSQTPTPIVAGSQYNPFQNLASDNRVLSFAQIKSKIAEAKRQMLIRPITTALTVPADGPVAATSLVRIAYFDWNSQQIDYIVISKDAFLRPDAPTMAVSTSGKPVTTRSIRANGVNTPVVITDDQGKTELPLLVQYPVERDGKYYETAYYMSTHPGLVTLEVVNAGRFYVHNVIDIARDRLRERGVFIQPKVADIAERLATVEHVDHLRFRTEPPMNIFSDIFTLYALNEGQTYRYSVSSAGAGGMVQMIPATYRMIRSRYPNAVLMPDFVEGMRNHVNATQAMLLYMQMSWNDLIARETISNAVQTGLATQEQLMAAGYNSNPARLAGYIGRGGPGWTSLIPRETQIYLQIFRALEQDVVLPPRKQ